MLSNRIINTLNSKNNSFDSSDIFDVAKLYFKFDLAFRKCEWLQQLELSQISYRSKQRYSYQDIESKVDYILDSYEYDYIQKYKSFKEKCCHRIRGVLSKKFKDKKGKRNYKLESNDVISLLRNEMYRYFINRSLEVNNMRKQELVSSRDDYIRERFYLEKIEHLEKKLNNSQLKEKLSKSQFEELQKLINSEFEPEKKWRKNWFKRISLNKKQIVIKNELSRINSIIKELEVIKASNYSIQLHE